MLLLLLLSLTPPPSVHAGGPSALLRARALEPPPPSTAVIDAEFENAEYFHLHRHVLRAAWAELGLADPTMGKLPTDAVDPALRVACERARGRPSEDTETAVRALFDEVAPGVMSGRLLTAAAIDKLRVELARVAGAGIPTRRPNGMNRFGIIPDAAVDGGVANGLDGLVGALVREYVRPLAQLLFPADMGPGDASEYFAFTIQYNVSGGDTSLAEHRDASVATLNLNLNTPEEFEGLAGSQLYFVVDAGDGGVKRTVALKPGGALLHRGSLRHAATPLTGWGLRHNLIIWLFGKGGYVRAAEYAEADRLTAAERWGVAVAAPKQEKRDAPVFGKKREL